MPASRSTRASKGAGMNGKLSVALGLLLPVLVLVACTAGQARERWRERIEARRADSALSRPGPEPVADDARPLTRPGDYAFHFRHQERLRYYRIHVPSGYRPGEPAPMLLSLHGGGGNMDIQAEERFYRHISQSERAGFIAVFPNGYSRREDASLATWNAGRCCGPARDEQSDDVGFLREVVARVQRKLDIDTQRIFVDGMSNGGMMAYRLACEAADLFRAVAAVAGTDNTRHCDPAQPVSILHIHARDDDMVLFEGGAGRPRAAVTEFTSVTASTAGWVAHNACAASPRRVLQLDGAYCDLWSDCAGRSEVKLCVTEEGGHAWPGGSKPRGRGEPSRAIDATALIWDFFASQPPRSRP